LSFNPNIHIFIKNSKKVFGTQVYFADSGIIGTKEFVSINYQRFKDVFMSKREKIPKIVAGLDGVYSLKRLAE